MSAGWAWLQFSLGGSARVPVMGSARGKVGGSARVHIRGSARGNFQWLTHLSPPPVVVLAYRLLGCRLQNPHKYNGHEG
jgi:hypothetical protein